MGRDTRGEEEQETNDRSNDNESSSLLPFHHFFFAMHAAQLPHFSHLFAEYPTATSVSLLKTYRFLKR